mgnify:FL=1
MRDRLVELLYKLHRSKIPSMGEIADHLLANGVIVPPCKVGDKVYRTFGNYCGEKIFEGVVDQISIFNNREIRFWVYGHPLGFACHDIGKTVFLTREEAEKALKGDK